jgi:hypothetical protein
MSGHQLRPRNHSRSLRLCDSAHFATRRRIDPVPGKMDDELNIQIEIACNDQDEWERPLAR